MFLFFQKILPCSFFDEISIKEKERANYCFFYFQSKKVQSRRGLSSYRAFFDGCISMHQTHFNTNNSHVILFAFWIFQGKVHFIGSAEESGEKNWTWWWLFASSVHLFWIFINKIKISLSTYLYNSRLVRGIQVDPMNSSAVRFLS